MKNRSRIIVYSIMSILIVGMLSSVLTIYLVNISRQNEVILSASEYEKLREAALVSEIADKVDEYFYFDKPERSSLLNAAAQGMVASLNDDYAKYYTNEEYEDYLSSMNGEYSGIGILVSQPDDTGAEILDVYEGNPAAVAGVQPGDIIIRVDGNEVSNMTLENLSYAINGEIGTKLILTLKRAEDNGNTSELDIEVTRAMVNIKRVHHSLFNQRTGYIRIDMFSGECAKEFEDAVRDLTDRGMKSLVIDLRNNPGGSLDAVVNIADIILEECTIVSIKGNNPENERVYSSNAKGISVPIAVMINENSASASEILAASVQENNAGVIVGMPSFGKGIVQTTMRLDSNLGWLKLTTEAYYTPNGNNIHGVGIMPDIEVDLNDELKGLTISKLISDYQQDDTQLWAALDYVRAKAIEQ